jgi:hypothetical protein
MDQTGHRGIQIVRMYIRDGNGEWRQLALRRTICSEACKEHFQRHLAVL